MSATGQWNVTINSPMGAQQDTLDIAVDGDTLTGTMVGPQGTLALEENEADGALSLGGERHLPHAHQARIHAEVNGDEISGTVKLGAFGNATFSGSRA